MLDLLQAHDLQATFFVVGQQAVQHPKLIRRIIDDGHELGNHTWSHSEPSQTRPTAFLAEILRTDSLLLDLTGIVPRAVRPPKGELNISKLRGLWRQQKTVALWNVDPRDYRMSSADEAARWAAGYEPQDGDVLLFHDNHSWAGSAIEQLASQGVFERYQTVTVSTLLNLPARRFTTAAIPAGA
jgi:peptidoglycan/xylan/chitin deacetylase (PgdA/CDA1 family)